MDYLGLGPEESYDDYYDDYDYDDDPEPQPRRPSRDDTGRGRVIDDRDRDRGDRHDRHDRHDRYDRGESPSRGHARPRGDGEVVVRRAPGTDDSLVRPRPINARPVLTAVGAATAEPHTVRPRRFDSAQEIADKFREGQPVIMNLEDTESDLSRRLIDFASGLCYGLSGTMEKVGTKIYLLKPPGRASFGSDL